MYLALLGLDDFQISQSFDGRPLRPYTIFSSTNSTSIIDILRNVVPSKTQNAAGVQLISCDIHAWTNMCIAQLCISGQLRFGTRHMHAGSWLTMPQPICVHKSCLTTWPASERSVACPSNQPWFETTHFIYVLWSRRVRLATRSSYLVVGMMYLHVQRVLAYRYCVNNEWRTIVLEVLNGLLGIHRSCTWTRTDQSEQPNDKVLCT